MTPALYPCLSYWLLHIALPLTQADMHMCRSTCPHQQCHAGCACGHSMYACMLTATLAAECSAMLSGGPFCGVYTCVLHKAGLHICWHLYWHCLQVVQGMLLTRPGFEERVRGIGNMQEMLKWLPSDLFRTCLARVQLHDPQALAANLPCLVLHIMY